MKEATQFRLLSLYFDPIAEEYKAIGLPAQSLNVIRDANAIRATTEMLRFEIKTYGWISGLEASLKESDI